MDQDKLLLEIHSKVASIETRTGSMGVQLTKLNGQVAKNTSFVQSIKWLGGFCIGGGLIGTLIVLLLKFVLNGV